MKTQALKLRKKEETITGLLQNKLKVLDCGTMFVLICHVLTDMVPVIEGKNIQRMTQRETKIGWS